MTHFLQQVVLVPHDSPSPRAGLRGADTVEEGYVRRLRWYSAVGMAQQQYFVVRPGSDALYLYDSRQDMVQRRPRTRIMLKDVVTAVHHLEGDADSMGGRRFDVVTMHKLVRLVGENNMLARRWVRSVLDAVTNWQRKKRALQRAAIGRRRLVAERLAESQSHSMPQVLATSGRDARTCDLVGEPGTGGTAISTRVANASATMESEISGSLKSAVEASAGAGALSDTACYELGTVCAVGGEASHATILEAAKGRQPEDIQSGPKFRAQRRDGALSRPLHRDRRRESQLEAAQYFRNAATLRQLKMRRTSAPPAPNGAEQVAMPMETSLQANASFEPGSIRAASSAGMSVPTVMDEIDDANNVPLSPMPYDSDASSSSVSNDSDVTRHQALDRSTGVDSDSPVTGTAFLQCSSSPIAAGWRPQRPVTAAEMRHEKRGNAAVRTTAQLEAQRGASPTNESNMSKSALATHKVAAINTSQHAVIAVETERSRVLRTLVGVQQVGSFNLNPCWDPDASPQMARSTVLQREAIMHVGQRGQSSGVETTTGADTADTDDVHHSRTAACADDARTQASVCPQPAPSPSATNRHERLAKLAALRRSRRMASRPTKAMEKASTGVCVPAASLPTTTRPTLVAPCERESAPRNSPRFSLKNLPETGRFVLQATPEQLPRVGSAIRRVGVARFREVFDSAACSHDIEKTLTVVEHEYQRQLRQCSS